MLHEIIIILNAPVRSFTHFRRIRIGRNVNSIKFSKINDDETWAPDYDYQEHARSVLRPNKSPLHFIANFFDDFYDRPFFCVPPNLFHNSSGAQQQQLHLQPFLRRMILL